MNIIAHCIDEISQLLREDFEQIEDGTLDFASFIKDVRKKRNLALSLLIC